LGAGITAVESTEAHPHAFSHRTSVSRSEPLVAAEALIAVEIQRFGYGNRDEFGCKSYLPPSLQPDGIR
jgi:hypothetical protein